MFQNGLGRSSCWLVKYHVELFLQHMVLIERTSFSQALQNFFATGTRCFVYGRFFLLCPEDAAVNWCDRRFTFEHPLRCIRDSCPLVSIVRSSRVCQRFRDMMLLDGPPKARCYTSYHHLLVLTVFHAFHLKMKPNTKIAFHLFYLVWLVCFCLKTEVPSSSDVGWTFWHCSHYRPQRHQFSALSARCTGFQGPCSRQLTWKKTPQTISIAMLSSSDWFQPAAIFVPHWLVGPNRPIKSFWLRHWLHRTCGNLRRYKH